MTQGKPVTVAGVTYPSFSAAERQYGIKRGVAEQRRFVYGWSLEEAFGLAVRVRPGTKPVPVVVAGKSFPSLKSMARAYGVEFSTLKKRVKKGLSIEAALELPDSGYRPPTKQLIVAGRVFDSIADACRAHDIGSAVFHNRTTNLGWTVEQALALLPPPNGETHCLGRIYKVTHTATGKAYIGLTLSSLAKRWEEHVERATKSRDLHPDSLQQAIRNFGTAAFVIEQVAQARTTGELADLERRCIERFKTRAPEGFNLADGGAGVYARGKPIRVGQHEYPSIAAACNALGVSEPAIHSRLASGKSPDEAFSQPVKRRDRGISFRGVAYDSISALARAHSAPPGRTASRLANGWPIEEALGLTERTTSRNAVVVFNERHESLKAAARAFGVSYEGLQYRLASGMGLEAALSTPVAPTHGLRLTYRGQEFASVTELASAAGVSPNMLRKRLAAGWVTEDAVERPAKEPRAVSWDGTRYPSLRATAKSLGLSHDQLKHLVGKGGLSPEAAIERLLKMKAPSSA